MSFSTKSSFAGVALATSISNGSRRRTKAMATKPNWLPGSEFPPNLADCDLPGCYGFDPLGFSDDKANLERLSECELIHGRWAMLASAGILAVELEPNAPGGWIDAALWPATGQPLTYVGLELPYGLGVVVAVEAVIMAYAEVQRSLEEDEYLRKYPGGYFDPLYFRNAENIETLKINEINNGRLAMVSLLGFGFQALATGKGPIENLADHIADPGHANIVGSGALPWLLYGL